MKKVSKMLMTLVASSALITSVGAQAKPSQTFSNVYTFGDSFSTPADSWAALITQHYGFNFVNNQTNFSVAGASTAGLNAELNAYKANVQGFDPNALYLMYMGPNDANPLSLEIIKDIIALIGRGLTLEEIAQGYADGTLTDADFPDTTADLETRSQNVGEFIQNLTSGGAKYTVVLNHFNEFYRQNLLGVGSDGAEMLAGALLSDLFNKAIYEGINTLAPSANIIYADYARLVAELSVEPTQFFTASELPGTYKNQGVFDNPGGIGYHPTAAAHIITNQYVTSVIESPSRVAFVREIPLAIGENIAQNIRSQSYDLAMNSTEKYSGSINGNYIGFNSKSMTPKNIGVKKSDTAEIAANFNYKANDNLVVGLSLNGDKSTMHFKGNNGKADIKELLVAINGTYKFNNPIFVYGAVGAGWLKYDIKRQIQLGQNIITEQGKPRGMHYMATIGTGYQYNISPVANLVPFVNVNYQKITMKSYTEKGELRSTTMSFNIPDRNSVMTEIGAMINGKFDVKDNLSVTPSLTLSYGYDFIDSIKKQAKARVSDMPREFQVPTYKSDRSYFGINGELAAQTNNKMSYGIRAGGKLSKNTKEWSAGLFYKYSL